MTTTSHSKKIDYEREELGFSQWLERGWTEEVGDAAQHLSLVKGVADELWAVSSSIADVQRMLHEAADSLGTAIRLGVKAAPSHCENAMDYMNLAADRLELEFRKYREASKEIESAIREAL